MARFLGSVQGSRGEATRLGHSSIEAHPRGWDVGVSVVGMPAVDDAERDAFTVRLSGGSNGARRPVDLLELEETAGDAVRVSVLGADGGWSVFYVDRNGELSSRDSAGELEADAGGGRSVVGYVGRRPVHAVELGERVGLVIE